ncbi:MAG: ATP-binding protein [Desulfobacterales bacterium]
MPPPSPTYRKINRHLGRAIHRHDLLGDGDRILVGLSGGKDSLALMWFLTERLRRVRITYDLFAVYLDPGFDGGFGDRLESYCRGAGYRLRMERTDYGVRAHSDENHENPCFLCAWNRRKRLFEIAAELGCRKLALGHNKDDIIETLFMNMCYAGEISTMVPRQPLFEGRFTVIRPLAYVDEGLIRRFAAEQEFPDFVNTCPSAAVSKRRVVKDLLQGLYTSNDKIKGNIFRSLSRVRPDYLFT